MYGRPAILMLFSMPFLVAATAVAQQPAKSSGVTDAEIAAIVVAANAVDAEVGDLAAARAVNEKVKEFGKTMSVDHRAVNDAAVALVGKLKVTPVESATSKKLLADGAAVKAALAAKTGAEFDRAYLTHEVEYHKAVIAAVDQLLIPSATNAELKQTLIDVRPAFIAHLQHAEHLLAGLK
jgi:putative membrane protein